MKPILMTEEYWMNKIIKMDGKKGILEEASQIRQGDRQCDYGDAVTNFENIAKIASIASNKEITATDAVNVLMAVKIVREAHKHKRDNLVDLCGYADIRQLIEEEKSDKERDAKWE